MLKRLETINHRVNTYIDRHIKVLLTSALSVGAVGLLGIIALSSAPDCYRQSVKTNLADDEVFVAGASHGVYMGNADLIGDDGLESYLHLVTEQGSQYFLIEKEEAGHSLVPFHYDEGTAVFDSD